MAPSPKEQIAAFYEEYQKRGKYDYLYGDRARLDLLVGLIGQRQAALEIGCRAGNLTQHYGQHNRVVGIDIDRNALELFAAKLGCPSVWLDVDFEPLPFEAGQFDVVVLSEVMEHLRFPAKVLSEIARVLKPAGRLVGSVPNSFRLRNRLRFLLGRPFETDPSHLRSYSPALLRRQLEASFRQVQLLPVSGHLLGGGRHGIPVFPWLPFRIRALFALDLAFCAAQPHPTS
ncbi:MAG: class I SAM-dependent methyltransferase [Verrucomicrobia bacterium]|nr:class I SAM-dependent methyltransferase [Verrucomicrobiota bacterium]